ncbi:TetR/AcrR family transcriptional regulator [Mobilicoccus pelagius]|uniref:TetR/AcrR family transcriptional regulator n=1 Tax=Mobilicoccus pelagius TaxID=746032 RepID=UPI00145CF39C|nr:TetR family transcriptional regulator C-terminal domain-containing protein [Mobilicoccus pelagius]
MPKIVDHAARREELARSVWALVGREGIEAATVRRVAAESGWSMGAVRHYFATQQELLAFAGEIMAQRVGERIAGLYAGVDARDAGPRAERLDRACLVLEQLLPMDEERAVEVVVWLAFMTRARTDPGLDGLRQQGWAGERFVCRSAVADACGLPLPTSLDARLDGAGEEAVDRLQVGVEGLSLIASTHPEHWPADAQRAAMRRVLLDACREIERGA